MVTYYQNTYSKALIELDLNSVLKSIQSDKYKDIVLKCRSLEGDEKKQFKAKNIPAFTVSGTFEGKTADKLIEHSGFVAMDFDGIDDINEAKSLLYADKYTYAGFTSVGGKGLCIIVKIDGSKHLQMFNALENYYMNEYGYQIDKSCSNVNRLRFVSWDPLLFINEKAHKWTKELKTKKTKSVNIVFSDSDIDFVIQQITAQKIDLTQDYQTWIELGMALKSALGESGINQYQAISQFHPKYNPTQIERKWASFKGSSIGIGTFFHHAKNAGLQIVSPKTKHITDTAIYAKKGRRSEKQVIEQLNKIDGIKEKESEELVKKVFESNIAIKTDEEDIVSEIEKYLKREYNLTYNEVTLKYENDGKPLNDSDYNSIYLNTKLVIPKASKDLVLTCIISDRTPIINPVQEWFKNNYSINKKGLISKLAECINTPTGYGDSNDFAYSLYFIKKWMIGAVAMWHGEISPIMLVLAGTKQNTGKTFFFRYLLPDDLQPYFGESELTGDKDENLLMCSKIMLLNDEMSNKSNRDIAVMKKLCSTQWFNLRKPYGKFSEDFRRIASLCGTSNDLQLLNDPTGNRRIIPIEVESINHSLYNEIDKTALWMEAYHAYKSGETYTLTNDDIRRLNESTDNFQEASKEAEMLMKYFKPAKDGDMFIDYLTNTEIKSIIEINSRQYMNQRKLGMELKRLGYDQKLIKKDNNVKRVYAVVTDREISN
jgi:hypothetical protein